MRRLVWWTIAIVSCGALVRGAGRLPPVDVLKCCRVGETLAASGMEPHCEPAASALWAPLVYAQMRRTYLPLGTVPPHWTVLEARQPTCAPGTSLQAVRSSLAQKNFLLFTNGSLYRVDERRMFAPGTYCAEALAALVCRGEEAASASPSTAGAPGDTRLRVHVRKCCGAGGAYSENRGACTALEASAEPPLPLRAPEEAVLVFVDGFPVCDGSETSLVMAGGAANATIDAAGALALEGATARLGAEAYCVERVVERAEAAVFACSRPAPPAPPPDLRFTLYPAGLVVSVIFLAATLVAGFLLPSSHHALHWRCQTHYIACLLLGDLLLAVTQLAGGAVSGKACVTMAILMHFFFLSAFFWLNTMCFNIWWTFRDFRPTSLEKSQETCRLRAYEVYAWGGPLLLAGVAAVLDHLPADPAYTFLRPQFGVQRCWFYGDMEILTFFFGPIGVLLAVNLVLFASTARQLTCGLWKREDVKSTTERAALGRVCMKLVVVMGVTWVADVVSWAAGGPAYVWYITDLINALQGVFIFIVVGCQPQVWAAVKRIWCVKKFRNKNSNTTGAPLHSSSQGLPSMGDSVTNNTVANTNTSVKIPMETVC